MGGDGGAGRGPRVDAVAAAGGGWQQGERAAEAATAGWLWVYLPFFYPKNYIRTLVFVSLRTLQVKPQERKAGGRARLRIM